ncbi:hypothetical protein IKE72_01675 [Candidatus Saccharibacteria bacterium]|nr:hypothetical protein [Candidatus Saccharibacteria bacterium]
MPAAKGFNFGPTRPGRICSLVETNTKKSFIGLGILENICYNEYIRWNRLVAMTRDCKSLGFGLRRFAAVGDEQKRKTCFSFFEATPGGEAFALAKADVLLPIIYKNPLFRSWNFRKYLL